MPAALLQRGSPDSKRNRTPPVSRHEAPEPQINENDIVYIHHLGEEPGPSQVPMVINQASNNSNTYRGANKAVKRGVRRYNTWTSYNSTFGSFNRTNTTSQPLCPYPTDGAYTYRDANPTPTRVLTVNEGELDDLLPCLSGPLGFDMEWKVLWGSSYVPKTALIQICDKNMILLIQISSMKRFPPQLKSLLESPEVLKMGVNISGDAKKLQKDFGVEMKGLLELVYIAKAYDPDFQITGRWISLANIVAKYIGKELNKGPVRVSNWEANLDENQLEYAASDVYCALQVYERLREIGRDNNVDVDIMTLADAKSRPTTRKAAPVPSLTKLVASESTDVATSPKAPSPPARRVVLTGLGKARKSVTPQQGRAYFLWQVEKKPLDEICQELRNPENPLKRSTAIGHIVEALKADTTLDYDINSLEQLLHLDYFTYKRYERWFKLRRAVVDLDVQMDKMSMEAWRMNSS